MMYSLQEKTVNENCQKDDVHDFFFPSKYHYYQYSFNFIDYSIGEDNSGFSKSSL